MNPLSNRTSHAVNDGSLTRLRPSRWDALHCDRGAGGLGVAVDVQHAGAHGDDVLDGAPQGCAGFPGRAAQVLQRHDQRHDV